MIEHFITGLCPQQYYESPSTCPRVKNIEHNGETIRLREFIESDKKYFLNQLLF